MVAVMIRAVDVDARPQHCAISDLNPSAVEENAPRVQIDPGAEINVEPIGGVKGGLKEGRVGQRTQSLPEQGPTGPPPIRLHRIVLMNRAPGHSARLFQRGVEAIVPRPAGHGVKDTAHAAGTPVPMGQVTPVPPMPQ